MPLGYLFKDMRVTIHAKYMSTRRIRKTRSEQVASNANLIQLGVAEKVKQFFVVIYKNMNNNL